MRPFLCPEARSNTARTVPLSMVELRRVILVVLALVLAGFVFGGVLALNARASDKASTACYWLDLSKLSEDSVVPTREECIVLETPRGDLQAGDAVRGRCLERYPALAGWPGVGGHSSNGYGGCRWAVQP